MVPQIPIYLVFARLKFLISQSTQKPKGRMFESYSSVKSLTTALFRNKRFCVQWNVLWNRFKICNILLMYFLRLWYIKYSKFWNVLLEHFIERKPLIIKEWIKILIDNCQNYLVGFSGFPNLFFLHSVWPWKRPIKALDSEVAANFPKPLCSAAYPAPR